MTTILHSIESLQGINLLNKNNYWKLEKNRTKFYWLSQFGGWMLFSIINTIVISFYEGITIERFLLWLLLGLLGISFTHILRSIIKKNGWLNLSPKKIILRVLISSLIIGTLMFAITHALNVAFDITDLSKFKLITPFVIVFNLSSVVLVWCLIYFSVHYFENYQKAEIEALIWEAAVKDFELKTLKSQLNPHFMFNAMNSIRALIEENPEVAKNAITKLSNILRYSLKIERNETVPFEEEIKTVEDYLALESVRFEERLKFNINISPSSAKVEIPPMMIQTLVENGIKHGISKMQNGGEITIDSNVIDSKLKIQIKNTGKILDDDIKNSTGFGLNNTRHRLNLLYGEEGKFNIHNIDENNVAVEIEIPIGGTKNESFIN